MKKFKLTNETLEHQGRKLYRIEALKDFYFVKKGEKGGFVEKEENLSQEDSAWVSGNAIVADNARISGDANISDNVVIYGCAYISGNADISGNAQISGDDVVTDGVKQLHTDIWYVTFKKDYIKIGCRSHGIETWKNFSDDDISAMDRKALKWWKRWKETIIKIAEMENE